MPETINTFKGGIKPDLAKSLPQQDNLVLGSNVRITVDEGQSSGVITNIKGNTLSFTIPLINTVIPNILGWATIRDDIYIFTTIDDGNGQIWKIKYDYTDLTLAPTVELRLNKALGFSSLYPIKAIGRYETSSIQKLYWVDGLHTLRYVNIASTNLALLSAATIDIFPQATICTPTLKSIGVGSLPTGMIQYAYKLISADGSETLYSPLSQQIHLVFSIESEGNGRNYRGNDLTTVANKAVTITISNLDTSFSKVQVIAIYRPSISVLPTIKVVATKQIISNTMDITHSSLTSNESVDITNESFTISQYPFDIPNDIASKDNILFVANTKEDLFDPQFDSRVYRYKSDGNTYSTSPTENTLDENNPYNKDDTQQFKYQSNGLRLGGGNPDAATGISYSFKLMPIYGDSNQQSTELNIVNSGNATPVVTDDGYTYYNQSFNNFKSPYLERVKGYKRGETYRFGIVFFSKRGRPSFAKWIGDIRMPEISDVSCTVPAIDGSDVTYKDNANTPLYNFPTGTGNSYQLGGNNLLYTLYVQFKVKLPSFITSQISGYQIVRVERTEADKSIVCQGVISKLFNPDGGSGGAAYSIPQSYMGSSADYFNTSNTEEVYSRRFLLRFISPEVNFYKNLSRQASDTLQVVGTVANESDGYFGGVGVSNNSVLKARDTYKVAQPFDSNLKRSVIGLAIGAPGNSVNESIGAGDTSAFKLFNDKTLGAGKSSFYGTSAIVKLNDGFGNQGLFINTGWILADYRRVVGNQYGGNSKEARGLNKYIPASPLIGVNTANNLSQSIGVFGGDTYVCYYDYLHTFMNLAAGVDDGDTTSRAVLFPVETSINLELRSDMSQTTGATKAKTTGAPTHIIYVGEVGNADGDMYRYNPIFSVENNVQVYIAKPVTFKAVNEFDCRVYFSDIKINGEVVDSWSKYSTLGYWDVESIYGPIQAIDIYRDKLLFWQTRGFGILPVNERSLATTTSGATLELAKSHTVLQRHQYISTEAGIQSKWAKITNETAAYFYDARTYSIYSFKDGLVDLAGGKSIQSIISGFKGEIQSSNNTYFKDPSKNYTRVGTALGYDYWHGEVLFTFIDRVNTGGTSREVTTTLVYSEGVDTFTSLYSIAPSLYIDTKQLLLSNSNNSMYQHNYGDYGKFYGTVNPASVTILINEGIPTTKTFDNFSLHTEAIKNGVSIDSTFTNLQCYTDYQDSGLLTLVPNTNIKRRERTWQIAVPRALDLARMRDKYLTAVLTVDNVNNYKLLLHYLKTTFRPSSR